MSDGATAAPSLPVDGPESAAGGGPLDLHKGISTPGRIEDPGGCQRWPEHLRLRSSHGELVRGRCRSTNLCAYCAKLAAVENAEVLALDALAGDAPALWAVLTTRDAEPDPARFYRSREKVMKALRRRWPDAEYAALVEFTTGYGPRSGGRRRPHWNLLLKGIPVSDLEPAAAVVRDVWCAREDAEPQAQYVGEISDAGGVLRYVALHFQKDSQAPPPGWRGHRFLKSRGYLATATPEARDRARRSLLHKRELWKALKAGATAYDAELLAREAVARALATTWAVVLDPNLSGGPEHPRPAGRRGALQPAEGPPADLPGGPTGEVPAAASARTRAHPTAAAGARSPGPDRARPRPDADPRARAPAAPHWTPRRRAAARPCRAGPHEPPT